MRNIYQLPAVANFRGALDRARSSGPKVETAIKEMAVVGGSAYLTGRLAGAGGPQGRKLFGMDAELVLAGGLAALGLSGAAGAYEDITIQAASGALAAYAARKGFEQGLIASARQPAPVAAPSNAPAAVSGYETNIVGAGPGYSRIDTGPTAQDIETLHALNRSA